MKIELITESNYPQVAQIYQEGIDTGIATFEQEAPNWDRWDAAHLSWSGIVLSDAGEMLGWAALTPVSDRCVYSGVAEVSVYVSTSARGRGVGTLLLRELITRSEHHGIWTLQAGIMRANLASIQLHERCGFRRIGYREKIGQLDGVWHDNIILERRSKTIGT
ncbi:phosphinothricin acetyltransferase [Reichenbachiella sp. 5M10]|uniref:GNAT family N-acetyltransferase n=1 Tax=Reichenbachiella sp. 5M10 TaxID=1889772 RepID=UPI000C151D6E|nr:GNAT family N-acetyltransferase [Reichenbachiella sp. 5M10]PIB36984.1 phosphinothricin acetyltransferase [Reichenbachiella sp. 5M10]